MRILFPYGLNENDYPDIGEAYTDSQNFELSDSNFAFKPRAPFDSVAVSTNASDIRGFLQLVTRTGTQTTLVQSGDTVYEWNGSATFTSRGTVNASSKLRDTYWPLGEYLVITDLMKLTSVKKWNGTTLSTLTTGLAGTLFAKYGVVHKNRVWLFNITEGSSSFPHLVLGSAFEDPENYNSSIRVGDSSFTTGNEAFFMVVPDLRAINGVAVFHDQLIISTEEGRLFKLTGSDSTNFDWAEFYAGSAAIGDESIANIGNDVVYMRAGGNVESLVATDQFGDVATDDLSKWIPASVEGLEGAIVVYDQTNQKVHFFVSGKVLVLFKDMLPTGKSPWSVYKTTHGNGFNTSAAKYMRRPGTEEFTVYFGGSAGQIYDLNGEGIGDGGDTAITTKRKTRFIDSQLAKIDFRRHVIPGRVQYRRLNEVNLDLTFDWGEEFNETTCTIGLKGPPTGDTGIYFGGVIYFSESIYFNQGFEFAGKVATKGFSPTGKGPGFFLTASVASEKNFLVDHVEIT
jgi:hypothetical protein